MNKTGIWVVLLVAIAVIVAGCSGDQKKVTQTTTYGPNVQPVQPSNNPALKPVTVHEETIVDADENVGPTQPDWVKREETAEGMSALRMDLPRGQAIAMAKRGARIDAMRNLMEKIAGLRIDSQTEVKDMVTESDRIHAESAAILRSAEVVDQHFDEMNGLYMVTVKIKLYDVWNYIKTETPYED